MKKYLLSAGCVFFLILGLGLSAANVIGLFLDVRPSSIPEQDLRFRNDIELSLQETLAGIKRRAEESDKEYAGRITQVIAKGLAHVEWKQFEPGKYNQRIPIWENYILYFMAKLTSIPEYHRYHFADYERSLERGIGICGDASMIMSQLLDLQGISNQIITFPGHVIVAAYFEDGSTVTYDPDFGVVIGPSPAAIQTQPSLINIPYSEQGYGARDVGILNRVYNQSFKEWDGVSHFITKKYYFEYLAYWLKWPLPIVLVFLSWLLLRRLSTNKKAN
ncbi:hypothetical protein [Neiella holothuriorum]|nr:hypothetical protein [Neiella holothuriorum]